MPDDANNPQQGALPGPLIQDGQVDGCIGTDAALPFTEDAALALLKRQDLAPDVLEQISKNSTLLKSRKVKLALVAHSKTPRHISVPLLRHLFTFDLTLVSLTPIVAADIRVAAEETLVARLETVSSGERLSLARRGSGRIAGELLRDVEPRVIKAALENGRLTEALVIKALMRAGAPAAFVQAVCRHPKWSLRREVRLALLRNENTPLAPALEFARSLPAAIVRDALQSTRLPASIKSCLIKELAGRGAAQRTSAP